MDKEEGMLWSRGTLDYAVSRLPTANCVLLLYREAFFAFSVERSKEARVPLISYVQMIVIATIERPKMDVLQQQY